MVTLFTLKSNGQKFAFVDSEYILEQMALRNVFKISIIGSRLVLKRWLIKCVANVRQNTETNLM